MRRKVIWGLLILSILIIGGCGKKEEEEEITEETYITWLKEYIAKRDEDNLNGKIMEVYCDTVHKELLDLDMEGDISYLLIPSGKKYKGLIFGIKKGNLEIELLEVQNNGFKEVDIQSIRLDNSDYGEVNLLGKIVNGEKYLFLETRNGNSLFTDGYRLEMVRIGIIDDKLNISDTISYEGSALVNEYATDYIEKVSNLGLEVKDIGENISMQNEGVIDIFKIEKKHLNGINIGDLPSNDTKYQYGEIIFYDNYWEKYVINF